MCEAALLSVKIVERFHECLDRYLAALRLIAIVSLLPPGFGGKKRQNVVKKRQVTSV